MTAPRTRLLDLGNNLVLGLFRSIEWESHHLLLAALQASNLLKERIRLLNTLFDHIYATKKYLRNHHPEQIHQVKAQSSFAKSSSFKCSLFRLQQILWAYFQFYGSYFTNFIS